MTENEPATRVTLAAIYETLLEVRDDVTTLKARDDASRIDDHETRIRALERKVWIAAGAAAAVGGVAGAIGQSLLG